MVHDHYRYLVTDLHSRILSIQAPLDAEQKAREKEAVGQGGLDLDQDCGRHSPRQDRLATVVGMGRPPGQKEADVLLALVR